MMALRLLESRNDYPPFRVADVVETGNSFTSEISLGESVPAGPTEPSVATRRTADFRGSRKPT